MSDKRECQKCVHKTSNGCESWDCEFEQRRTITLQLQDIVDEMCDKYCKWPSIWNEETEGIELTESDICANCPLNRLV